MKSNIKYISDEKESKLQKEVVELIKERINENKVGLFHSATYFYYLLVYSKYIIERDNLNASNIIGGDIEELLDKLRESEDIFNSTSFEFILNSFKKHKIYEFLKKIIYEDYEIVCFNDRVVKSFIDNKKKILIICEDNIGFVNNSNVDILIYSSESDIVSVKYKIYNKITGFNNKYNLLNDNIDYTQYDKVFFYNSKKANDLVKSSIKHFYYDIKKFYMICNYSEISKYNESLLNIKSIIMDKDKVYIEYIKLKETRTVDEIRRLEDSDIKICLKELTNLEDDKLKEVIESDKEKENICIYASLKDFKNNSHRLGFKAYNRRFDLDRTKVLRLIDYNEKITRDIDKLNKEISQRIDEIIVR